MAARVTKGLVDFLGPLLGCQLWDGETPRYDPAGNPINPNTVSIPSVWPAMVVLMPENGFAREWTFEDAYEDKGDVMIHIWATSRDVLEAQDPAPGLIAKTEEILAQGSNWSQIQLGGPPANPFYVIKMLLTHWTCVQDQLRTAEGELLYRGDLRYEMSVHGAVPTG